MRIRVRQDRVCAKRLRQTLSHKRTQRLKLVLSRGRQVLVSLHKRFSRLLLVSIFSGHAQCLSRSEVPFFPDDSVLSLFSKSVRKSSWDLRRFVHSVTFSCLRYVDRHDVELCGMQRPPLVHTLLEHVMFPNLGGWLRCLSFVENTYRARVISSVC